MQQAYQALRVISEAQTVHIVLEARPGTKTLTELRTACLALQSRSSDGIKAVILDFVAQEGQHASQAGHTEALAQSQAALHAVPQPVLGVVRATSDETTCTLLAQVDFLLVAYEAELCLSTPNGAQVSGSRAVRTGHAAWGAPDARLDQEMERILGLLRSKSALALRNAKASVRLALDPATDASTRIERLQRVNQFYLDKVITSHDAREGLQAFAQKREPRWQNR